MNYTEISQNEAVFRSMTSLGTIDFEYLLGYFEVNWLKYYKYHTLEGKKRMIPGYKEHKSSKLKGTENKLFFLLVYLKNNPLQTFQGASFGISQAKVSQIIGILLGVLDQTLRNMGLSPCRDGEQLAVVLAQHKEKTFNYDGTERMIQRNIDGEAQAEEYSGKKGTHTVKNNVLSDDKKYVHYLSATEAGSVHDKKLADMYPISLPAGSVIRQDLGFLGHIPIGDNLIIEQPYKKPKNAELSFSQKLYNKILAQVRVFAEHTNAGIKILRIVKDTIRIHKHAIRDLVMVVACGLNNLRVTPRENLLNLS